MLPILVILVFTLFDTTISFKSQGVNLELETVFELENDKDINLLSHIQKFVNKVKNALRTNHKMKSARQREPDLLKNLLEIVKSLRDDEITQVFGVAGDEVKTFDFEDSLDNRVIRRLISNKLVNLSKSPSKVRSKLDQLLRKMDKNNKLTKLINIIYKKDSKRDISRFLKKLALFRRSSKRPKEDLSVIAQNMIYDILEKYDALTRKKKQIVQDLLESFMVTSGEIKNRNGNKDNNSNNSEAEDEKMSNEEDDEEETPTIRNKVRRTKKSKKLTHITLYPSSIEIDNSKKRFNINRAVAKNAKTIQPEGKMGTFEDRKKKLKKEEEEDTEKVNTKHDSNDDSLEMAVEKEIVDVSDDDPTTAGDLKTLRHHKKSTTKLKTSEVSSKRTLSKSDEVSSYENFGSLHKPSKTKKKTEKTTKYVDISDENNTFDTKKYIKTTKFLNNNLYLNRRAQNLAVTDNNKTSNYNKMINTSEEHNSGTTKINEKILEQSVLDEIKEITEKYKDNQEIDEVSKNEDNSTTVTESLTTMNLTTIENITFDVNNYLNNSEINNIKDIGKKKKIEDIMKEDLNSLFSTTTNSTDGYTDMFKDLEDAFDFS